MNYFDFNATTPLDPSVVSVISHHLEHSWGNPSSGHAFGKPCRSAVEDSREKIAKMINADSAADIIFTSGGTESNNLVFHSMVVEKEGLLLLYRDNSLKSGKVCVCPRS
jgi:selenocysteine lyase